MGRLDGKVALITGAAQGQGATEAELFAREGASVVVADIQDRQGCDVAAKIKAIGGQASYVHLDVTSEQAWRMGVEHAEAAYGKLDVLVNNAGLAIRRFIEEMTVEEWDRVMSVNVTGVFLGTKYSLPAMRRAGGGSIVNISSVSGLVGYAGRDSAYIASKGAVRLFTKATAMQHASEGIRCNSVHPGPIATEFIRELTGDPDALKKRLERLPLGRLGTPEDVAFGVLYLASDESSWVTGSELVIDGGTTAQ